ncbi:MAG: asparagine synthase (glutamine-hydrolyzing) [Gammaproteobacteria bacterium]|nr:asparagine synthase (glutamine-hydrolyzing) [Gammaproteobacteria bacterium]
MCGIAGIFAQAGGAPPQRVELERAISALAHRGPDGHGFYQQGMVGLAHARLSIIDLAGGAQPIHNEDETVWVVFNGEIFNYVELREFLQTQGHRFYTHSDTEVLVHLYEHYGLDFAHHLNGQFALALWDQNQQQLILCRDRAGILPLFYAVQNGRVVFASEIKAVLPVIGGIPALNPAALDQVMTFWSTLGDTTMFEGVRQVLPGEMLIAFDGGIRKQRYWDWRYPSDDDYHGTSVEQQAEELRALLSDATRIRLRADVPVGAYLSGGLDSSVLATLIRANGITPETYSIRFNDAQLDEGVHQQRMAEHLGVQHHQVQCSEAAIGREFPRAIWHTETPILRNAPVPMMLLSGLVHARGAKVVLTGEGADEVLGGYDIFKEAKLRRFWARNPKSLWRPLLLKRLYPYLEFNPARAQSYSEAFFGTGLDQPNATFFAHLPRWSTTAQSKQFYAAEFKARLNTDPLALLEQSLPRDYAQWHSFNRAQYVEAKVLMANYLLWSQGDRMLMANSVEGRFPFLDQRVIEFAARIHPNLKMKVLNEKFLLKHAFINQLPASIVSRSKQPYRAPDIPAFFHDGVALDYVDALLADDVIKRYGYFDAQKTGFLLKKIRAGRAIGYKDNMALVAILSTQMWHHLFVENRNYSEFIRS